MTTQIEIRGNTNFDDVNRNNFNWDDENRRITVTNLLKQEIEKIIKKIEKTNSVTRSRRSLIGSVSAY